MLKYSRVNLETSVYETNKNKSKNFLSSILYPELLEIIDKEPTIYNLSEIKTIFFDNSFINPLYKVYKENLHKILESSSYFPDNIFLNKYNIFYLNARKGYINTDGYVNFIHQAVRDFHYKKGVESINDPQAILYVVCSLFLGIPDKKIIPYLDFTEIPTRLKELEHEIKRHKKMKKLIKSFNDTRSLLIGLSEELIEMIKHRSIV